MPEDPYSDPVTGVLYNKLGLDTVWFHGGVYQKFSKLDLLLSVRAVIKKYERWNI